MGQVLGRGLVATPREGPTPATASEVLSAYAPAALRDRDYRLASDDRFSPATIKAAAGEELLVEVHNEGNTPHELTVEVVGFSTGTIKQDRVVHGRFEVPEGETTFSCRYHDGMEGTIIAS